MLKLTLLILALLVFLWARYIYKNELLECESCHKQFKRKNLAVVSTSRRGLMRMCALCARADVVRTQNEINHDH